MYLRVIVDQDQTVQNVQPDLWSSLSAFQEHWRQKKPWTCYCFSHITKRQILDSSKLKEFPDDNFKFHENERKLSKQVENTVGKGEIARYEQFLLFPQWFQKACFPGASKVVIVWKWVKDEMFFWVYLVLHGLKVNKRHSDLTMFHYFAPSM